MSENKDCEPRDGGATSQTSPSVCGQCGNPAWALSMRGRVLLCPECLKSHDDKTRAGEQGERHVLVPERALSWLFSRDTGLSSMAMWACFVGVPNPPRDYPLDAGDFGRCLRLLDRMPEWRAQLRELRVLGPVWERIVDKWGYLEDLYRAEDFRTFSQLMSGLRKEASTAIPSASINATVEAWRTIPTIASVRPGCVAVLTTRRHTHYYSDCPEYRDGDLIQTTAGTDHPEDLCPECERRIQPPGGP